MRHYIRFAFSFALIQLLTGVTFATTTAEVKSALSAHYKITTRSGFTGQVKQIGTVLVLQKEGIRADVPNALLKPTVIKNREIERAGGGGVVGGSGHNLKVGDRLHLYKIKVEKDYVLLLVGTADTYDTVEHGSTVSEPYEAAVGFQYDAGLTSVTAEEIMKDISAWFQTEKEAATASTKTVHLGQTPDEVTGILGVPTKKIDLGAKIVFVYKDIKVIFVDGKVADVQ